MTRLGLIAAALAAFILLGWYAKGQTEKAAVYQSQVSDAREAGEAWRLALDAETTRANAEATKLAASVRGYDALRTTTERRIGNYEKSITTNAGAADWDSMLVPAYAARRMCEYTDESAGSVKVPANPETVHGPAEDPTACAFSTGDLWRWTERILEVIDRANEDRAAIRD